MSDAGTGTPSRPPPLPPPLPNGAARQPVIPYATPIPLQAHGAVWREGPTLIVRKQATLPERCVKCNAPADGAQPGSRRVTQKLAWHHPALFLLILAGLLLYAIVALIVQQKATVVLSLCPRHNAVRRRWLALTWISVLAGAGLLVGGLAGGVGGYARHDDMWPAWVMLGGATVLVVGGLAGAVGSRSLSAKRMEGDYAWLKGAGDEFLAVFPAVQRA